MKTEPKTCKYARAELARCGQLDWFSKWVWVGKEFKKINHDHWTAAIGYMFKTGEIKGKYGSSTLYVSNDSNVPHADNS